MSQLNWPKPFSPVWIKQINFWPVDTIRSAITGLLWKDDSNEDGADIWTLTKSIKGLSMAIEKDFGLNHSINQATDETNIYTATRQVCNLDIIFIGDFSVRWNLNPIQVSFLDKYREKVSKLQSRAKDVLDNYLKFMERGCIDLRPEKNLFTDLPRVVSKNEAMKTFELGLQYFQQESNAILLAFGKLSTDYTEVIYPQWVEQNSGQIVA